MTKSNSAAGSDSALAAAIVGDYLRAAVVEIDAALGAGFSAANPALLAGFVQAMAIDRSVSGIKDAIEIAGK